MDVIIPDGVTRIGEEAFCQSRIKTATILKGVVGIGSSAFSCCRDLESVNLPTGLEYIGAWAFSGCVRLKSITIPDSLKHFGRNAFKSCRTLENVVLSDNITIIPWEMFSGCISLKSIIVPESVTTIEAYAFENCQNLESIIIPKGVTRIGDTAFVGCTNLASVEVFSMLVESGKDIFKGCPNISRIILPKEIKSISLFGTANKKEIFNVMRNETNIHPALLKYAKNNKRAFISMSIDVDSVKILSIMISSYSQKIDLDYLNELIEKASTENKTECLAYLVDYKNKTYSVEKIDEIENDKIEKKLGLKELSLADWKKIYTLALENDGYIIKKYKGVDTDVIIPGEIAGKPVVEIGKKAFAKNENIFSVIIPESVITICGEAFKDCTNLTSITFSEGVRNVGHGILDNTAYFNNENNWENDALYLNNILIRVRKTCKSIIIKDDTEVIAVQAFKDCKKIKTVAIPNGVTSIEIMTFLIVPTL